MSRASKGAGKKSKPRAATPSEFSPGIFVGGWKDAVRFQGSRFCVLDEAPADMPTATHVPIYDEGADRAIRENLDRLVRAMRKEHSVGNPVLVFCGHGVRRSPLAAAWYLRQTEGVSLGEAYHRIRSVRPRIEEAHEWIADTANLGRS